MKTPEIIEEPMWLPPGASRILTVGQAALDMLRANGGVSRCEVAAAEWDADNLRLDGDEPAGPFDAVLLAGDALNGGAVAALLAAAARVTARHGYIVYPATSHTDVLEHALAKVGWRIYIAAEDSVFVSTVGSGYDPVARAREWFSLRRPDLSYAVLSTIPEDFLDGSEAILIGELEKQLTLLALDRVRPRDGQAGRFFKAQFSFYLVISTVPDIPQPYLCQAQFWRQMGDDRMANRLLRSIQAVYPSEEVARALAQAPAEPALYAAEPAPGPPSRTFLPRVLMLLRHDRPHFGLDVLYDGLSAVLGDDRVVEYPWKPSLHGQVPVEDGVVFSRYPCLFDRPGEPLSLDAIESQLRFGAFDCVLYGDIEGVLPEDEVRRVVEAAGDLPFFVVDQEDDCGNSLPRMRRRLGCNVAACFKRELLHCVDFGPEVYPLPFAFPESRVPELSTGPRPNALFWAGHRQFGLRRLYLEYLEERLGRDYREGVQPEAYAAALQSARAGLSLFGVGFDTIRYWELPAHGCMLLSERPPIRIPSNFESGVSAVLVDDTADLVEQASHVDTHPDETEAIAAAGREHLLAYHTGRARALQMLSRMEPHMAGE